METEKVCVNLSAAELGSLDVLVAQGLYTSRSDVIRTGIRLVGERHEQVLSKATKLANVGVFYVSRRSLENVLAEGSRMRIFSIGIVIIDKSVTAELADQAIEHVRVLGAIRGPAPVMAVLKDRLSRNLEPA